MTLQDVYDNERVLSRGLDKMTRHINEQNDEIRKMLAVSFVTFIVNEHTAQLVRALGECRRYYEILTEAILNAQKGILPPYIISPMQLMNEIMSNEADIPSNLMLPVPLSAAFQHFIIRIIEIDVFFKDKYLVYVIHVPLTKNMKYAVYHVLPLSIRIRNRDTHLETTLRL
jgi:hypothetical protein